MTTGKPKRTPQQEFLERTADVCDRADEFGEGAPILVDDWIPHIARATGRTELECTQALYGAGRLWYCLIVPRDWFTTTTGEERLAVLRAARELK